MVLQKKCLVCCKFSWLVDIFPTFLCPTEKFRVKIQKMLLCSYCCCLSVFCFTPAVVNNQNYCLNSFRPAISWSFGCVDLRVSSAWPLAPGAVRQRYLECSAVAAVAAAGERVVHVVEQPGCLLWVVGVAGVVVVVVVAVAAVGPAG